MRLQIQNTITQDVGRIACYLTLGFQPAPRLAEHFVSPISRNSLMQLRLQMVSDHHVKSIVIASPVKYE